MNKFYSSLIDNELNNFMEKEYERQDNTLEMIASENIASPEILKLQGSVLTNKYAEGYPYKRYYGGCEWVDEVEQLAINRLKNLYHADMANVQAHSGSQANMAAYLSLISFGDKILGMSLKEGGHLTHGFHVNFSGKLFDSYSYGVNPESGYIDYEEVYKTADKAKPNLIVAGASAYPRIIDFKKFREIADAVGAYLFVDMAHIAGLVAADVHPSPVPYADIITSTTHKTLRGPRGGLILAKEKYAKKVNSSVFPGTQGGPLMHVIAAKARCFLEASTVEFKNYQVKLVENCKTLATALMDKGFKLVTDGTDNHLLLVDLRNMALTGKFAQASLENIGITANKNTIPNDPESPNVTSGMRFGTAALTSRGMEKEEMLEIADIIYDNLVKKVPEDTLKARVKVLCKKYPLDSIYE